MKKQVKKKKLEDPEELVILAAEPRSARSTADVAKQFIKEISKIATEDVIAIPDMDLRKLMRIIKNMRNNRFLLAKEDEAGVEYVILDFDVKAGTHIAMRKNKMLGTGSYEQCAEVLLDQIRREFADKVKEVIPAMLDDSWIKNFSTVHFGNPRIFRIIDVT